MSAPPDTMRVLHVLHQSPPRHESGYDVRSHYILEAQRRVGIDACALTGPFSAGAASSESVAGVTYYHTSPLLNSLFLFLIRQPLFRRLPLRKFLMAQLLRGRMDTLVRRLDVGIIHAHTPWLTALPALEFAKEMGLPFIYEVRGMWEESEATEGVIATESAKFAEYRSHDNAILSRADAIVAISEGLREEIMRRKIVDPAKIHVVPNAVDAGAFAPLACDGRLAAHLGLTGKNVIGYISSLRKMEGLDLLLRALPALPANCVVLIVGDGPEKQPLEALAGELGITGRVVFTGRVPHEDIRNYYSLIDIFVVPRIDAPVCHIVTPLKPLEAMAMGKCVLASDVGGLKEMVRDGSTGFLFTAGDEADLASRLTYLLAHPEIRDAAGERAREFVLSERTWEKVAERYCTLYHELLSRSRPV